MPSNRCTFIIPQDKLDIINSYIDKKSYPTLTNFILAAIDKYIELHKINMLNDVMYPIGIAIWVFLISVGLTLYLASLFFYVITALAGFYLIMYVFMFYKKYEGVKWR